MTNSKYIKASLVMQGLAAGIKKALKASVGDELGFMLIVFQDEPDGRSNYVSNCDRAEVIKAMEFTLQRLKEGMPDTPAHKIH